MSKKHHKTTEQREEIIEEVVEPVAEVEEANEEPVKVKQIKMGKVFGCNSLNIRKAPDINAEIVCTIDRGTEVEIDEEMSTSMFYKSYVASGVEGFCMRDFIRVE